MNIITKIRNKYSMILPAVKAGFWFTICNILQRGIQFMTTPLYTRLLSSKEYGLYSVFTTWLNIISIFASLNLSSGAYYNGMIKYENHRDSYTSSVQSLGTFSTIFVCLIFTIVFPILEPLITLPYSITILMFIIILVQPAFQFWSVQQRINYHYKALIIVTLVNSILAPCIGMFLIIKLKLGYEGVVWGYVIGNMIVCGFFYIKNLIKGKKVFSKEYWNFGLSFSIPLIPHYLSQVLLGQSDRVMINYFCGSSEAGIYSLAYQVSLITNLVISGINSTLTIWMYHNLKERRYKQIRQVVAQLIIFVAMIIGIAMFIGPEIISFLGTEKYLQAIWVIPPVMFSTCITFIYCIWGTVLFFFEETKKVAIASSSGAIINVILNLIVIPKYGFISAAYTTVIGYLIIFFFYWYFTKRVCCQKDIEILKLFDLRNVTYTILLLLVVLVIALGVYKLNILIRYVILTFSVLIVFKKRDIVIKVFKSLRNNS